MVVAWRWPVVCLSFPIPEAAAAARLGRFHTPAVLLESCNLQTKTKRGHSGLLDFSGNCKTYLFVFLHLS